MKQRTLNRKRREKDRARARLREQYGPNPARWGPANARTQLKMRKHPFEHWLKRGFLRPEHMYAALRITTGYLAHYHDTMYARSKLERIQGGTKHSGWTEHQADCALEYEKWSEHMRRYRIPIGVVVDLAVFEKSPRELDRKWNKRKGWSKLVARDGLDLFVSGVMRRAA